MVLMIKRLFFVKATINKVTLNSLKNSPYYCEAINEIVYDFGTFYMFETFIVAEINEGIVFTWEDQAEIASREILDLYDSDGHDIIYISNRINNYAVMPSDWVKFFKNNFRMKGYAMVNYTKSGHVNSLLEKLFISHKSKRFNSLKDAVQWAKSKGESKAIAS